MNKQFYLSVCFCVLTFTGVFAQGFSSFKVEGALLKPTIKNVTKGASRIEAIVGNDIKLENVKFKYALLSECRMEDKISNDFSSSQKVEVYKGSETKEWIIQVKKLQAAQLPLKISFSNENPSMYDTSTIGWVTSMTDETKPSLVRFGNKEVSFIVAFDSEAKEVSYDLQVVGDKGTVFDGKFEVAGSTDGLKWTALASYDKKNPFMSDSHFTNPLDSNVRYVKWTYVDRQKQNVNLNNITVNPK